MAERQKYENENHPTLPQKGKVKDVCQKWLVHEDGALAYVMQNQEIDDHFDMNRFNRRTVRDDMPVARTAQQEEEIRLQEERLLQIEALTRQAAEDEMVAKEIADKLEEEETTRVVGNNKSDEEFARVMQHREQRRYERQREKRQERQLQRERQQLEERLLRQSEEARIARGHDSGSLSGGDTSFNSADQDVLSPPKDSGTRVTPAGVIEDEGDFSDFYLQPSMNMEPTQRKQLQEVQDEELARLLQEQEHKRTKAEVNREKLRDIEKGDEELARVMQEQEKLRLLKAKQRKQRSVQDRSQQPRRVDPGLPPYRSMSVDEAASGRGQRDPQGVLPPPARGESIDHDRLFGGEARTHAGGEVLPGRDAQTVERWLVENGSVVAGSRATQDMTTDDALTRQMALLGNERLKDRPDEPQRQARDRNLERNASAERVTGRNATPVGRATPQREENGSRRNVSAERVSQRNGQRSRQTEHESQPNRPAHVISERNTSGERISPQSRAPVVKSQRNHSTERTVNNNCDVDHSMHERIDERQHKEHSFNDRHPAHLSTVTQPRGSPAADNSSSNQQQRLLNRSHPDHQRADQSESYNMARDQRAYSNAKTTSVSMPVDIRSNNRRANSPESVSSSASQTFNIAMAIDPTYHRRQHEINQMSPEPQHPFNQQNYNHSELEWDPSVRGSLRRQRAYIPDTHPHSPGAGNGVLAVDESGETDEVWQPVQGQRRTLERGRSSNHKKAQASTKKGGCKQQ